ncbi:PaaI family thioesterase [Pseudomonas capsici]|uniref:PaaI family thioesterase n=1 Tax=Pseudomonas capsici TaxID=2810614 RepID=UPI000EFE3C4F|nr:PaaI family thioesterase [Pseudomonas capsici]MCV4275804.1 PaaI family thioesterase [Pseudomonas capsici]
MEVAQVLTQWQADEESISVLLLEVDATPQDQIAGLSGMEVFEAIFAGQFPPTPIGATLDFIPIRMAPSIAILQGRQQRRYYNPLSTVHGGWFATLLDSTVACACAVHLPVGQGYTTLEHGAPLSDHVPLVCTEGKVILAGSKLATAEARIFGSDGELYAHVATTYLIFIT